MGERGPEIVIGRETTQQIMMNEPGLLQHLVDLDRYRNGQTYRAFDSGNVYQIPSEGTASGSSDSGAAANGNAMTSADARALTNAIAAFVAQCQKPLAASINMYGTNGLYEQHKKAARVMSRYER